MALLFFDGFETGSSMKPGWSFSGNAPSFPAGRYAGTALSTASTTNLALSFTPSNTIVIGVAIRPNGTPKPGLIQLSSDSGATKHLTLGFAGSQIELRRGNTFGLIIAAYNILLTPTNWYYFEIKATIADSGGTAVVRLNGTQIINYTGDTRNGGTSTQVSGLHLSDINAGVHYDDMYICDGTGSAPYNDFAGNHVVSALKPNNNGAANQYVGSDADSVDNYLLVDEDPFSASDYVGDGTIGNRDLYEFTNYSPPVAIATVGAVQVLPWGSKTDAGARDLAAVKRSSGGTAVAGSASPMSTTDGIVSAPIWETDADGASWTTANLNTHQFGVETA